ncbi:MAG TPA: hypothetical protein VGQ83_21040 [Polyangia bacterium]|jgi:hypothetical protein
MIDLMSTGAPRLRIALVLAACGVVAGCEAGRPPLTATDAGADTAATADAVADTAVHADRADAVADAGRHGLA